jgi:HD superfamily phosphohydrolase
MKNYFEEQSENTKKYYEILSKDFPMFLNEYIYTTEMQKLAGVNQICGGYWRKENIYEDMYSVLKHSVGVALIIWNFTKDKKQTIAGLLHDISSPAFKHCIDFLNGDAEKQESTEEQTLEVIKNSKEIMSLLKRDEIKIEEVSNYKIYSIADNKTPKLSADRLEYTFMNGTYYKKVWDLNTIKEIYENIEIMQNEENNAELGFKTIKIAEKFVNGASKLWPLWIRSEDTIIMYFLADIIKIMCDENYMTPKDLYELSEQEIINLIKNCDNKEISERFNKYMKYGKFIDSEEYVNDKFCVSRKVKKRYINPLTKKGRIYDVSSKARKKIDEYLNTKISKYAYLDT